MKKIIMTTALAALALTGCVNNEDPYFKIKAVSENEVAGCKYIGNLTSSSKNFGLFNETAGKERLANAKQSAYNFGANRIVLAPSVENGNTTISEGKAYICP